MAGTSATLLARKWESALLVNVDNDTLRRVLNDPEAMAALKRIEGWRALGDRISSIGRKFLENWGGIGAQRRSLRSATLRSG
ncbi:MAG: hypothetical protein WCD57_04050 [Acidobacteriaceae bacterium]